MGDISVTLSLDQEVFTKEQLQQGIFLKYDIKGGSLTGDCLICFARHGSDPEVNINFPFTPASGSGAIKLSPMSPYWDSIPWSTWPPKDNIYYWDIVLIRQDEGSYSILAKTTLASQGYPPEITLAHYDKDVLNINWTNPGSYTDFVVQLHDTSGSMHYNQPATGTSTTITQKLDQDKTYLVSVYALIDGSPGPQSNEVTLIVIPPVVSQLQYTLTVGAGKLDVSWGAVGGADLYITTVYTTDGSFKQNIPSADISSQLESTLDQSKQYMTTVCATANNGIVIGPSSDELAAIIKEPDITRLQYSLANDQGKLDTTWDAVNGADLYITTVYTTDGSYKQNIPSENPSSQLEATLDQSRQYKTMVYATANNGVVIGPSSDELTAIIKAPQINLLQYSLTDDQGKLDTTWEAVAGTDLYITTVYTTDGSYKQNIPSANPSSQLEATLDQSKQYKTTVYATANSSIVIGPASSELAAIITCPGNLILNYTGQNLRSDWVIPASLQGKQFTCELYKDGAKLADKVTGDNQASFDHTLDAGGIYVSQVRGESGVVKGPWTQPAQGPYAENIMYAYDSFKRLKSMTCHGTATVAYTVDNPGNILAVQNN